MGKLITTFITLILISIAAYAQTNRVVVSWSPTIIQVDTTQGKNDTLIFDSRLSTLQKIPKMNSKAKINLGEKFEYEATWGFITAAFATIFIDSVYHTYNGRKCYKISSITTSAKKVDFMGQKVRDTNYVYYDAETHRPLLFKKIINEGSYHRKRRVLFDHVNNTILYKETVIPMGEFTQDMFGAIFMVRNKDLKVGSSTTVDVVDDGIFYSLQTKVLKKEKVKTDYGKYSSFKVEPILQSSGIFKNEGKMWIWFSDTEDRIPLMIKAKVVIGSVKVKLTKYHKGK